MKNKILFLLIGTFVFLVAFKKDTRFDRTFIKGKQTINDTISPPVKVKLKIAGTPGSRIHLVSFDASPERLSGTFFLLDSSCMPALSAKTATDQSLRARTQMKAYLDSLIMYPKSIHLLPHVKPLVNRNGVRK